MRTRRERQFLQPAYVLAGYDKQTIETEPTDHDGIQVDVHGNVGVLTVRLVAGHRLRYGATAAFPFDGDVLADKQRRAVAFIHVVPLNQ